ncbi:hypothetical protein Bca4012_024719 [Brassica carinata]
MSSSSLSLVLSPPPVPPDLLFLQPSSDPVVPLHPSAFFQEGEQQPLVSPPGAEVGGSPSIPAVFPPLAKPSDSWAAKVKSSFQPLVKIASPSVSTDGIPSIRAPDSITLVSSTVWKDHLVAFFHGRPPSPAKVFADLNPIWGKNGNISVKQHSKFSLLIYIPCPVIRQWALDVAFWHSGNCSFTAMLWHPSLNLSEMKLVHAPVWVLFKKVPFELWSLMGFSTMASAVGFPVHSEHPDLKPYTNGVVKLRVVIELDKPRPSSVRVTDKLGNSVFLPVEFLKIPPKCGGCGEYGHLRLRCPQPSLQISSPSPEFPSYMGVMASPPSAEKSPSAQDSPSAVYSHHTVAHSPLSVASNKSAKLATTRGSLGKIISSNTSPLSAPGSHAPSKIERANSLPLPSPSPTDQSSSSGWCFVVKRSGVSKKTAHPPSPSEPIVPVTDAKFAEEEELISAAQCILRSRLTAIDTSAPENATSLSKKRARKKIRQKMHLLSRGSGQDNVSASSTLVMSGVGKKFGLALGEQAPPRSAHFLKA